MRNILYLFLCMSFTLIANAAYASDINDKSEIIKKINSWLTEHVVDEFVEDKKVPQETFYSSAAINVDVMMVGQRLKYDYDRPVYVEAYDNIKWSDMKKNNNGKYLTINKENVNGFLFFKKPNIKLIKVNTYKSPRPTREVTDTIEFPLTKKVSKSEINKLELLLSQLAKTK